MSVTFSLVGLFFPVFSSFFFLSQRMPANIRSIQAKPVDTLDFPRHPLRFPFFSLQVCPQRRTEFFAPRPAPMGLFF